MIGEDVERMRVAELKMRKAQGPAPDGKPQMDLPTSHNQTSGSQGQLSGNCGDLNGSAQH